MPLVSVVMVCYNHEKFCLEALNALKGQSYNNIQLIIMDDCSSDNSVHLISKWIKDHFEEAIFIAHKNNIGLTKTLNEAISYVSGAYVAIISCDDKMLPTRIEDCVFALENTSDKIGACVSDMIVFNEKSKTIKQTYVDKGLMQTFSNSDFLFEELIYNYNLPSPALFYKKNVFDVVGKYDETLAVEDNDFLFRFSKKFNIVFIDKPLVAYRMHQENFSKDLKNIKLVHSLFMAILKHVNIDNKNHKAIEGIKKILLLCLKRADDYKFIDKLKMYKLLLFASRRKHFALNIIFKDLLKYVRK
ncbi:MAG: glycosyltransferase [Flavobacteriaceae bacterium]